MDCEQMMIKAARESGRKYLHSFAIGVIGAIANGHYTQGRKVSEIKKTISAMRKVYSDDTLPWDLPQKEKAPAKAEGKKEFNHINYSESEVQTQ